MARVAVITKNGTDPRAIVHGVIGEHDKTGHENELFLINEKKNPAPIPKNRAKAVFRIGKKLKQDIESMFGGVKSIENTSMLANPDDPNEGNEWEVNIESGQGDKIEITFSPDEDKKGVILAEGKKTEKDGSSKNISEAVAHRVYVLIEDTRKKLKTWLAKAEEKAESFRIEKYEAKGELPMEQVLIYLNDEFDWIRKC